MSKLPNFWQFFNLTSQPTIPSLYWDAYSYEERIKKICDKIWSILNYLKLVMELLNEFDDRLTVVEELYNTLETRVTKLESLYKSLKTEVDNHEERITELENEIAKLDIDGLISRIVNLENKCNDLSNDYTNISNNITTITTDLNNLKDIINNTLIPANRTTIKIADPSNTNTTKNIKQYRPLLFKSEKTYTRDDANPDRNRYELYEVDGAPIIVANYDDYFNNVLPNNISPNTSMIIINDNVANKITYNNKDYILLSMICTESGYMEALFRDSTLKTGEGIKFSKNLNDTEWTPIISEFVASTDDNTAKTASIADPTKIYYVPED